MGWELEPAWDHVVVIRGFEVGEARRVDSRSAVVDVVFTVVGRASALRYDVETHLEVWQARLSERTGSWRIDGPPPPPHVFATEIDAARLQADLRGSSGYLSQSRFLAEVMRAAGWQVPLETVGELLAADTYGLIDGPQIGDVAVFLDRTGNPYHVGVVESPGVVVSATLVAGIIRSPFELFSGDVRFMRLRALAPQPDAVTPETP